MEKVHGPVEVEKGVFRLVHRGLGDLGWRLPAADDLTPLARAVREAIGPTRPSAKPEVDLVVRPGSGRFGSRAECRLLVTSEPATSIAGQADVVIDVADDVRAGVLDPEAIRTRIDAAV